MSLELLIDSANTSEWENLIGARIFSGITTNPTLLKKENLECNLNTLQSLSNTAEELGYRDLHIQAWGDTTKELITCGNAIKKLETPALTIHVKIPITSQGIQAAYELIEANISVTFTACYEAPQSLIAASLGATYLAPYLSRINDAGKDGCLEVISMKKALDGIGSDCKLLVASIRNKNQLINLASEGISTFTISPYLAETLMNVPETINASLAFEKDSKKKDFLV